MLSRRLCGELLAGANSFASLAVIARALGFVSSPEPLDRRTRGELGISDHCVRASIQRGRSSGGGTLRALLLDIAPEQSLRDRLTKIAQRLGNRGSPLLWLLCAIASDRAQVAIGVIDLAAPRARVRALVCDSRHVTESDAETLAALAAGAEADDAARYARWLEILGRDAVSHRFFTAVARQVELMASHALGGASDAVRNEVALIYATRLLFLAFLESKGWLDGNRSYLVDQYAECMLKGGGFHERVLLPLFFGTLNTRPAARAATARSLGQIPFLNGGLFARSAVEKRSRLRFSDEAVGAFLDDVLTRYRFTAREESTDWSEAAVDPEMLGKAFESLMAAASRRGSGAYYTPNVLVAHVSDTALQHALSGCVSDAHTIESLLRGESPTNPKHIAELRSRISSLRVLDPACGSGAFLVHVLERLAELSITLGDLRPRDLVRRSVLASSIFGVDVNPTAVWLCELRLWLSCVIDSAESDVCRVPPLPNLDRNIRVGDALLGEGFERESRATASSAALTCLRLRYARATGRRKAGLARSLDRAVRRHLAMTVRAELDVLQERRRSLLAATRGRDLFGGRRGAVAGEQDQLTADRVHARELRSRLRVLKDENVLPFSFRTHFADVVDVGGFDVVLGNPPWVRPHNVGPVMRASLRSRFTVLRDATWRHGATIAGARSGFGGQADLAAAFIERSLSLLREQGTVALLVPAKLWKSLAGGGVRRRLGQAAALRVIEDWSDAPALFDAAVYPSFVVVTRGSAPNAIHATVHRRDLAVRWQSTTAALPLDDSPGSPWLILPPEARAAFDRLSEAGVPLHACGLGRVTLGVKTGCNAAFVVAAHSEPVESSLLRPALRGEDVSAWHTGPPRRRIIWTHARNGSALDRLPPLAEMHLSGYRYELEQRSDARGARWWSLFRTDTARTDAPRVVWADLARVPRAAVLRAGDPTVPLNTCYALRCRDDRDALTLAALINSPLAAAWLRALAEPARGGYRRLLAWTMALLPVPDDWARARDALGSLGARAMDGHDVAPADLFDAACAAYRIRPASVAALCDWMSAT